VERRLLQIVICVAVLVPLLGGGIGAFGPTVTQAGAIAADSHHRYLSGLLLAIGFAFLSTVPRIERHTARFRLLAALVMTGGLVRRLGVLIQGQVNGEIVFALVMELGVTPALMLWQGGVAARSRSRT
jgi:hypothetical protein